MFKGQCSAGTLIRLLGVQNGHRKLKPPRRKTLTKSFRSKGAIEILQIDNVESEAKGVFQVLKDDQSALD